MNKYDEKTVARIVSLRKSGCTYAEIQNAVGYIPKASLSYICRNIEHSAILINKIKETNLAALAQGRQTASINRNLKQEERILQLRKKAHEILRSNKAIDKDKVALAMLYLGEGRKRRSYRGLSLGGSDEVTLKIYVALLKKCYGKDRATMRAAVQYRADQNRDELVKFWAEQLRFSRSQFYLTRPDMRTEGKLTKRKDYHGVCVVTCSGADIQLELSVIAEEYAKSLWGYSSVD